MMRASLWRRRSLRPIIYPPPRAFVFKFIVELRTPRRLDSQDDWSKKLEKFTGILLDMFKACIKNSAKLLVLTCFSSWGAGWKDLAQEKSPASLDQPDAGNFVGYVEG